MYARNVFFVVIICLFVSPTAAVADGRPAQNAITTDLIVPAMAIASAVMGSPMLTVPVGVQYQRVLSEHSVLSFNAGFMYQCPSPDTPPDSPVITDYYGVDGWELTAYPLMEMDWHPFHKGLDGFYTGAFGGLLFKALHVDTAAVKGTGYEYDPCLGLVAGWQFLLPANIVINLALGYGGQYFITVDQNGTMTSGPLLGTGRMVASVGFRF